MLLNSPEKEFAYKFIYFFQKYKAVYLSVHPTCLSQREGDSKNRLSWDRHRLLWQAEGAGRRLTGGLYRWLHRLIRQEQEAAQSHHFQHFSAGGAGEGVSEDTLPWRVCPGTVGAEDRAHRGSGSGMAE